MSEVEGIVTDVGDEPVEVVTKKKRTSKTWLVTVNNGIEDYVVKIRNVASAEEAKAKVESSMMGETVVSIKPARTYK